jgi:hypothetical protein
MNAQNLAGKQKNGEKSYPPPQELTRTGVSYFPPKIQVMLTARLPWVNCPMDSEELITYYVDCQEECFKMPQPYEKFLL